MTKPGGWIGGALGPLVTPVTESKKVSGNDLPGLPGMSPPTARPPTGQGQPGELQRINPWELHLEGWPDPVRASDSGRGGGDGVRGDQTRLATVAKDEWPL